MVKPRKVPLRICLGCHEKTERNWCALCVLPRAKWFWIRPERKQAAALISVLKVNNLKKALKGKRLEKIYSTPFCRRSG